MIVVIVLLAAALIVVLSVVVAFAWRSTVHGLLSQRQAHRVIVTLKTSEAFTGVLFASDRDCLVLREAVAVGYGARNEDVPVEGEALILRADVAYIQLTGGTHESMEGRNAPKREAIF